MTRELLLEELRAVCGKRLDDLITYQLYKQRGGTYSKGPFFRHFGNWMNAVKAVGGVPGNERRYSVEQLYDEMQRLWEEIGQQPTWHEMLTIGTISPKVYVKAFGSWRKSITAFCDDRNDGSEKPLSDASAIEISGNLHQSSIVDLGPSKSNDAGDGQVTMHAAVEIASSDTVRRHPRSPSQKIRFKVFVRDKFCCQVCGRTSKRDGVRMVIDHIFPWEKGGQTVLDNLQVLCEDCNLGKSNEVIITI